MSKKLILTALIVAWSLSGAVSAANFTWQGDNSQAWNDPNNWDVGVGLPSAAAGDIVFINAVTPPNLDPNIVVIGASTQQLYIQNDGVLNIFAGTNGSWGLSQSGSSYNNVNDGTLNVWGSYTMSQNLYIAHTDTAGSYGIVNIYAGGTVRTNGVLTIAGRRGDGEMNIWGTYLQGQGTRWNYLPRLDHGPYTSVVRIYQGGLWRWTGDHITNTTDNWNNVPWIIANGHLASGVVGYEPVAAYDLTNNWTDITIALLLKAYNPVYSPALLNDGVNVNRVNMSTASGTIDLSWTKPLQSGIGDANRVQSTVYMDTYIGTAVPAPTTVISGPSIASSVTGVPITKLNNYCWRVDSYDPNTAVTTVGDVWTFDTQNIAPIASAESSPQRIWLVAGAANITLHGTSTDDGYPLPSPTYTYTWSQVGGVDILATPSVGADVTLYFDTALGTLPQTRNFQVVCNDGAATGPAYAVAVTVYANGCLAGQGATGVTTGDLNSDCMVNFKDFALLANTWNVCKTYDLICPF